MPSGYYPYGPFGVESIRPSGRPPVPSEDPRASGCASGSWRPAPNMPCRWGGVEPTRSIPRGIITLPSAAMYGRIRPANLSGQADDIAWFEANRIQIARQYPGQWVIVKDLAVVGAYPDFQTAYTAGISTFGTQPFLVKQAAEQERPIREGAPT